jgi:hypothetical protein
MDYLGIRDLQKISGEAIAALSGPTPIKSGNRTVGILIPLRRANLTRLSETLARAEVLSRGRDPTTDDEALREFGEIDPTDWSREAVDAVSREGR